MSTPGPVASHDRIPALDAARGVALLGILFVNVQLFFEPLGRLLASRPPEGAGDAAAWWFVKIFCEGKFYPLFSMLFGMGLVLQLRRARTAGRPFTGLYLRRLALLAAFGIAHIVLIWAGDILLVYSIAGLILLLASRLSTRALLAGAAAFLLIAELLSTVAGVLSVLGPETPTTAPDPGAESTPAAPAGESPPTGSRSFRHTPFGRLIEGFESGTAGPPNSPLWIETESEAMRQGPFSQALLFRLLTFAMHMVFMLFGSWWHVLAMFMLGAALMRLDIFEPHRRAWHRRFLIAGALVGLPLAVLGAALPSLADAPWAIVVLGPPAMIGATLMSLGYLGAVVLAATSNPRAVPVLWLARAGRMALTIYLAESVLATFFSYHWGLAWFGRLGGPERLAMAAGMYAVLLLAANLWLRAFRMGPMEWLWRTGTYLRPSQ
jgi:uncharacterized protein